ncbi:MAG: transglutaminase domain-containing protein [Deltaproteobacteria bacterium]|nr:transglutaminase domain-containing protein [Deltaproteobacteria bacterium]
MIHNILRLGKWFFFNWKKLAPAAVVVSFVLAGCGGARVHSALEPVPSVVTADIQAGIEKHVQEQSRLGGGYFVLPFSNKDLRLKLVRVHVEYLANLGPRYHFACVDLADTDGDVYDVDFFLKGDPGDMTVTETTVHKINGQPLYTWAQKPDHTWHRVPVDDASQHLLGVITGQDVFQFLYRATLPEITENARMWIPLAVSDAFQTVRINSIRAPGKQVTLNERNHGNKVLFLELAPQDSNKVVEIRYQVQRIEKSAYAEDGSDLEKYLKADRLVPVNEEFRKIAGDVLEGKKGDLVRARALYDHVIDRMCYKKYGKGWGKGDAVYACDIRAGNCTDFHSYFIALSRAAGIPARFAIGAGIPSARDEGGISGYHCWAEFHAEGKWWPVDISEGDKYSSLATYYFGHHPANRIELSRGRDLLLEPGPALGAINFFAYPIFEMGGESIKLKVSFSFIRDRESTKLSSN